MPAVDYFPSHALIGGDWVNGSSSFDVRSPSTGAVLTSVADCGEDEARRAVDVASRAFESWRRVTPYDRAAILRRWCELMLGAQEELARLMAMEMGKPVAEARGEARYAAGFVEFYAEEAKRVYGDTIPSQFPHKRLFALRQPVGPVYAITPWNFPAAMVTRKAAPALAAGCTVILKPAEQSPLTSLRLAELWLEAGAPPGTLQVLTCADPVPVSRVIIADPRIRKLSFTGSTEVGMRLYAQVATTMKRLSLELGGNAPFLVFDDADIPAAVREVLASKFRNAGQTCVCTNRVYVQQRVHDEFVEGFTEAVRALRVGDPLDEATQIGPLVDRDVLAKVKAHVADATSKGARVLVGGENGSGTYYPPTVLTGVHSGMRILQEETFGPVAPVIPFATEGEALQQANDTTAGLAAYLWTRDLSRAFRVAEELQYGIIGVNDGLPSTPQAPFGGVKYSGIGREGGTWGLEEYLDVKYVAISLAGAAPS